MISECRSLWSPCTPASVGALSRPHTVARAIWTSVRQIPRVIAVFVGLSAASTDAATTCETPTVLVDPVVYQDKCPSDPGFPKVVNANGRDVYIILPKNKICTKRLLIKYARNVRIVGGAFIYNDTAGSVIAVDFSSGTTLIEGLDIDSNAKEADAITSYAHTGRMIVQNTRVHGIKGSSGGTIRDFLEARNAGPLAELKVKNVTVLTGGRGLFSFYSPENGRGTRRLILDRVDATYDAGLPTWPSGARPPLLYFGSGSSTKQQVPPDGTTLTNVYVDGSYWGVPYDKTVYARPAPQPDGCATFDPVHRITGRVCLGPSPEGENAPADRVGLRYDRDYFCGPEVVGQCDPRQVPPAPARDAGFTRLAFCEDFSDKNTINLDGALAGGQTLTQVKPGNIFNSSLMPKSAFVFNADGTMTVNPTRTNYQVDLISTVPTGGGGFAGYAMTGAGWYAEIRWKHANCNLTSGFPAFWSMDARKLYAATAPFYEPDFYEFIGGKHAQGLHYYPSATTNAGRTSVAKTNSMPVSPTSFFTAAAMSSADGAKYSWYINEVKTNETGIGSPAVFKAGKFPILFGSGPGCPYTVDWVRVWR